MSRQSLRDWIREQLAVSTVGSPDTGHKKCTAFSLIHFRGGVEKVELKTIKLGSKQYEPKDLADMFDSAAETYAGGVSGSQQFAVFAFFDEDSKEGATYTIRKNGDAEQLGFLGTEPPTTTGLVQQLMRHVEAHARMGAQQSSVMLDKAIGIIERLDKRCERLETEQFDTIELAKELIIKQAADSHSRAVELVKLKQGMEDRKRIWQLAPSIVNKVTGKEIFPQSTVDTALIETLAEKLTAEQLEKIAAIVPPEIMGLLADRMITTLKAKAEKEAAERAIVKADAAE